MAQATSGGLRHVYTSRDGNAVCDVADEVERLYGHRACVVTLGAYGSYGSALYVDTRLPTWEAAYEYARELVAFGADAVRR
jgi:hypothetical protein